MLVLLLCKYMFFLEVIFCGAAEIVFPSHKVFVFLVSLCCDVLPVWINTRGYDDYDSLLTNVFLQDISAVAKAWLDSPYLFIVKVQPLLHGIDDDDIGAEQFSFTFTSEEYNFYFQSFRFSHIYSVDNLVKYKGHLSLSGNVTFCFSFPQWKLRWRDHTTTLLQQTGPSWWYEPN